MPSEPDNRKIEELLRAYGRKRQGELGAPLELHPVTRKMLQREVAKSRPGIAPQRSGLFAVVWRFWPRFAVFGGVAVLLSLAIVNINRHPNGPEEFALNKNSKESPLARPVDSDKDLQQAHSTDNSGTAPRPTLAPVREQKEQRDTSAARKLDLKSESEVRLQRPLARDDASAGKRLNAPLAPSASSRPAAKDAEADGALAAELSNGSRERLASDNAKMPSEQPARSSLAKARPSGPVKDPLAEAKGTKEKVEELGRQPRPTALNESSPVDSLKLNEAIQNQVAQNGTAPPPASAPAPTFGFDEKGINANRGLAGAATKPPVTASTAPSLNYDAPQGESLFRQKESTLALAPATQPVPPPAITPALRTKAEEQEAVKTRAYFADSRQIGPVRFRSAPLALRPGRRFEEAQAKKAEAISQAGPLASTFDFQQSGETIRLVDADGSVYDGRLLPGPAAASSPASRVELDDFQSSAGSKLKQSGPLSTGQTGVTFTASGTNLSLGKLVVIRGDLIGESTSAKVTATTPEKVNTGRAAGVFDTPVLRPAGAGLGGMTPRFTTTPFVPSKIQGTLRVDRTNEFPIDATRMAP